MFVPILPWYCAVYKHSETGHSIDWNNPQIIGHDNSPAAKS